MRRLRTCSLPSSKRSMRRKTNSMYTVCGQAQPHHMRPKSAVTKNVRVVPKGAARYGLLLNADGGVKDDVLVYREEEMVHVVVNCSRHCSRTS